MSENNDSFEPIEKDSLNPVEQSQSAASDEVRNTNASTTTRKRCCPECSGAGILNMRAT